MPRVTSALTARRRRLRADVGPLAGGLREVRGARAVAGQAVFYSQVGLVVRPVGAITVRDGKIVEMDLLADPERLRQLDLTILDD